MTSAPGCRPRISRLFPLCLVVVLAGCATSRIVLPQGAGVPLSDYEDLFTTVTDPCRRVRTMELMLALSGQAGEASLRGRVRGALARPASLRLEGLAPFGAPRFILVAHPDAAVLVLPRARRVVSEASAAELLDALAGVALGPADFGAVLTGCLMPDPQPRAARTYGSEWIGIDLAGGATLYLRTINGAPVIAAGTRDGLVVEYLDHARGLPRRVRVQSSDASHTNTDLTAILSQVNINTELHAEAFVVHVREDYVPMTLDELRRTTGPLEESPQPDP